MTEKQELEQRVDELCATVVDLELKLQNMETTWSVFMQDRKSVVQGKSVDPGGRRIITKKI